MKLIVKILACCFFVFCSFWLLELFVIGKPIIIEMSTYDPRPIKVHQGDTINPLDSFMGDNLIAYLIIDKEDGCSLDSNLSKGLYLKTNNCHVLKDMIKNFNSIVTGGDMATVQSLLYIVRDHKIIFKSGIVLDKNMAGLQNRNIGWTEFIDRELLINTFGEFDESYWPIIFL